MSPSARVRGKRDDRVIAHRIAAVVLHGSEQTRYAPRQKNLHTRETLSGLEVVTCIGDVDAVVRHRLEEPPFGKRPGAKGLTVGKT